MKSITRKIVLLISISSIITGGILIVFQLDIIPRGFDSFLLVLIQFWPVTLIIAGGLFLWDSFARRYYHQTYAPEDKLLPLPYPETVREVNLEVHYAFGNMVINAASEGVSTLHYEQFGPMPEPICETQNLGNISKIRLHKAKQYFAASSRLRSLWTLSLAKNMHHVLFLAVEDADCSLDLRELIIQELSMKAGSGLHTIFFPATRDKFNGNLYSGSNRLSLMFPENFFVRIRLINPFCRVDFPQGDFEKKEDGTITSIFKKSDTGHIELQIDGPLRQLAIDIV